MSIPLTFALASLIIGIGFLGHYASKKFSLPDLLILIFLGIIFGPITNIIDSKALIDIAPTFAALALTLILFDGGLNMKLSQVTEGSFKASILAILGVLLSMGLGGIFLPLLLNWGILEGMLLGTIVGGTSSAVVLSLVRKLNIFDKTATILSLESVFTDALVVVLSLTLLEILTLKSNIGIESIIRGIVGSFSLGTVIGIIFGLLWLKIFKKVEREGYNEILTLGVVLGIYALAEFAGGNGGMASLLFGIVLGNGPEIIKYLKKEDTLESNLSLKRFHGQISFLMRTFFFVYLGLIVSFSNLYAALVGVIFSFLLLFGRYLLFLIIGYNDPKLQIDKRVVIIMLPRGLAAAVLTQYVISSQLPNSNLFLDIVTSIIITTVIISIVGSRFLEKVRRDIKDVKGEDRSNLKSAIINSLIHKYKKEWKDGKVKIIEDPNSNGLKLYVEALQEKFALEIFSPKGKDKREKILELFDTIKNLTSNNNTEVRILLDDITATSLLKELVYIQNYINKNFGKKFSLWVLNLKDEKMVSFSSFKDSIIK